MNLMIEICNAKCMLKFCVKLTCMFQYYDVLCVLFVRKSKLSTVFVF